MGVWIMSIVGVICLGILLEIVLPEGQTAKYVKGAFSLLVVFVIAVPLPNLLGKEWKLDLSGSEFKVDEEFIGSTHAMYSESTAKTIEKLLSENGYESSVTVAAKDSAPLIIERVEVRVSNFKQEVEDAVSKEVKRLISDKLKCGQDCIFVTVIPSS